MELTTSTKVSTLLVAGLILASVGCTSYEKAVQPYIKQYAAAGCLEKIQTDPIACRKIQLDMQEIKNQYGSGGGGGTGSQTSYIYIIP